MKYTPQLIRAKKEICVSVILPVHFDSSAQAGRVEINAAVENAVKILHSKFPDAADSLMKKLIDKTKEIEINRNNKGIGIYISADVSKIIYYPFAVEEKIVVKDLFEIQEVLSLDYYSVPYFILQLHKTSANLFKGHLNTMNEINDEVFPLKNESGTKKKGEFADANQNTSSLKEFYCKADRALHNYLNHNYLIISGTSIELALFKEVTKHRRYIVATIVIDAVYPHEEEFCEAAWLRLKNYLDNKKLDLVKRFENGKGEGFVIEGVSDVWEAARNGRGWKLMIEKDLPANTYPNEDDTSSQLVVDEIIESILDKKGEVYFYEKDFLKDHHRIALLTRYPNGFKEYKIL